MIYVVKMVLKDTNHSAFIGLSKTFAGCFECLRKVFPTGTEFKTLSWSPTGTLLRHSSKPTIFIHIMTDERQWNGDVGWVITKRHPETRSEEIYAVFDDIGRAKRFIETNVDEPTFSERKGCKITEIDGYVPFAKIIGDTNPELNRVHFTIYETDVLF